MVTFLCGFYLIAFSQINLQEPTRDLYGVGEWNADSLGNHRAVVQVEKKGDYTLVRLPWRRRDIEPEKKGIIIIDSQTGEQVKNVLPIAVNREYGDILFQASSIGEYYIYYLQYRTEGRSNYPTVIYPSFQVTSSSEWRKKANEKAKKTKKLSKAKLVQFQSIDEFNSFYPMELIATKKEVKSLLVKENNPDFLLFPETRENSIRMTTDLPAKWIYTKNNTQFLGEALKGEYYTFQIGFYASNQEIKNLSIDFSSLINSSGETIGSDAFTCFNTEGIDWKGNFFQKDITVKQNTVQPLWIGVQIPKGIESGFYEGKVNVKAGNLSKSITLKLTVTKESIVASGDNEPERLSRLRWLNSTIGEDDGIIPPYSALEVEGNTIKLLGRQVKLNSLGFPESIQGFFSGSVTKIQETGRDILASPVELIVEQDGKSGNWQSKNLQFTKQKEGTVAWKVDNQMEGLKLTGKGQLEFDGNIDYELVLTATKDMKVNDIRLEVPLKDDVAKYMMGLGQKGGYLPDKVDWKWKVEKNQDGPWVGDVNAGIQARFRSNNYERPLNTNFYLSKPLNMPDSWFNKGRGGIKIEPVQKGEVSIISYSGERMLKKGDQLHFYFNLLITPFRTINTKKHWENRYYHSYKPIDEIVEYGANTINVHHANDINPFINYPFLRPNEMKAYVDEAHSKDRKVKIYYTVRELSNKSPELFALRSFGDEVLSYGDGGGFSWLQEHLDPNYIAAWFVPKLKDAAVINSGISRWHNYYMEGLNWLVKNIGIDGLYIDDVAFDRTAMKRVRKVLQRGNPEALIDLHSANQFNPRDGFANSANLYLENLPFIDRLWFGEYFDYDFPPEFWLIETSGIPYGLMGEMLQDGGNPWRGMLFGMTSRAPWSGDPGALWKFWDDVSIQNSEMIGFWDPEVPVLTDNDNVKATVYANNGSAVISIGSWEEQDTTINLSFDWDKLNIDPEKVKLYVPAIKDFQQDASYNLGDPISIKGKQGLLIYLK